jgi:hypothetical protein
MMVFSLAFVLFLAIIAGTSNCTNPVKRVFSEQTVEDEIRIFEQRTAELIKEREQMNGNITKYNENISTKRWQCILYRRELQELINKAVFDQDRNFFIRMDDYNYDCIDSAPQQAVFEARKIGLVNSQQGESLQVQNVLQASQKYLKEKSVNSVVNEELKFCRNESWKLNGTVGHFKGKIRFHKREAETLNLLRSVNH